MQNIINQTIIDTIQIHYNRTPLAVFLIGANGSGKSTLRTYLNLSDIQTNIDPDVLNRICQTKYPKHYQIQAAKQALTMYHYALENNLNVCIESTLAGKGTMHRIREAKKRGYYLMGYFVGLNHVELNLERIAHRVRLGGHHIEELIVRKRYQEALVNLSKIKESFDELHLLDNSKDCYELQFSYLPSETINHQADNLASWVKKTTI